MSDVGAALDQRARGARGSRRRSSSKLMLRKPGSLTSGLIEAVREVGPSTPTAKRGLRRIARLGGVAAGARQPRGLAVELRHQVLELVVGLRDLGRVEGVGLDQVGAGLEVGLVDGADQFRPASASAGRCCPCSSLAAAFAGRVPVRLAFGEMHRRRRLREARAAVAGLVELVALDHRAHGAVDDQDALATARAAARSPAPVPAREARSFLARLQCRALRSAAGAFPASPPGTPAPPGPALAAKRRSSLLGEAEVDVAEGRRPRLRVRAWPGRSAAAGRPCAARAPPRRSPAPACRRRSARASAAPGRIAACRRAGPACRPRAPRPGPACAGARWPPAPPCELLSMHT